MVQVMPDSSLPPGWWGPEPTPYQPPTGETGSQILRQILAKYDLEGLYDLLNDLYTNKGVTDIDELLFYAEDHPTFQARFPGIRDPETKQLIMKPGQYVQYEKDLDQLSATYGVARFTRQQVGQLVANRRAAREVAEDLAAFDELRNNPYAAEQYFAYTGRKVNPEDLFGLVLGLRPDLEDTYRSSVVTAEEYEARLQQARQETSRMLQPGQPHQTWTPQVAPGYLPAAETDPDPGLLTRSQRLQALRNAQMAAKAGFKAGGGIGDVDVKVKKRGDF